MTFDNRSGLMANQVMSEEGHLITVKHDYDKRIMLVDDKQVCGHRAIITLSADNASQLSWLLIKDCKELERTKK